MIRKKFLLIEVRITFFYLDDLEPIFLTTLSKKNAASTKYRLEVLKRLLRLFTKSNCEEREGPASQSAVDDALKFGRVAQLCCSPLEKRKHV